MTTSYLYCIRIKEQLDPHWSIQFDNLTVTPDLHDHTTTISGIVRDQAALRGLLNKLFNLGLTLVALDSHESFRA